MKLIPLIASSALALAIAGCAVGPNYQRPTTAVTTEYKAESLGSWKEGQPLDNLPKDAWWEVFGDLTLKELEHRATEVSPELKAAVARVEQARATARVARSELLPTISADPSFTRQRYSPNQDPSF